MRSTKVLSLALLLCLATSASGCFEAHGTDKTCPLAGTTGLFAPPSCDCPLVTQINAKTLQGVACKQAELICYASATAGPSCYCGKDLTWHCDDAMGDMSVALDLATTD